MLPRVLPEYFLYLGNTLMMYAILALGLDLCSDGRASSPSPISLSSALASTPAPCCRYASAFRSSSACRSPPCSRASVGLLIAIPATRLRTVYLALATYAFAECAQWVFRTWDSVTKGGDGLRISPPDIFGYVVGTDRRAFPVMAIILALVLLATLSDALPARSRSLRDP